MKVVAVIKYLFLLAGGLLLLGAVVSYHNADRFLESADSATGFVVSLEEQRGDGAISYRPVVAFIDTNERMVHFTSRVGSSPAAYAIGEQVRVLYPANQPEDARINDLFELWGGSIIMAIIGAPFFLVGLLMMFFGMRKKRKNDYLQKNGVPVMAQFQEVQRNRSVSVNGKNPYVILCHWLNPQTSEIHVFESENIWFDPSRYIGEHKIRVLLDKRNYAKYLVDISFLPNVAN